MDNDVVVRLVFSEDDLEFLEWSDSRPMTFVSPNIPEKGDAITLLIGGLKKHFIVTQKIWSLDESGEVILYLQIENTKPRDLEITVL